jgi:O-antigen/teichoic acid export membrane protein
MTQAQVQAANPPRRAFAGVGQVVHVATLFVARGLPAGLRAIVIFTLANRADKLLFSQMGASFALVETLRIAFDCGQDTISIRLLSRVGRIWRRALYASIWIKACTWTLGFAIDLALLMLLFGSGHYGTALAIALLGVTQIFWNVPLNLMQARGWIKEVPLPICLIAAALAVLAASDARLLQPRAAIAVYVAIEYAGLVAFALMAYRQASVHGEHFPLRAGASRRKQIVLYLRRGWSVTIGQLAALAYGKFDVLLVVKFSPTAVVAYYLLAQRMFDLTGFVIGGASSVMYANIVRTLGRGALPRAWSRAAARWAVLFTCIAGCIGMYFWVVGPVLIERWFSRMGGAIGVLPLFGVVAVTVVVNQYLTALLNSLGRFSVISKINVINFALILVLGSVAYYVFSIPGLLLSVAFVYASSAAMQAVALKLRVTAEAAR